MKYSLATAPLVKCAQCKGKGEVRVSVSGGGEKPTSFKMPCPTCKGAKTVPAAVNIGHKKMLDAWCKCGNKSGNVTYHPDGARKACRKHHWTCDECGKIVQVG